MKYIKKLQCKSTGKLNLGQKKSKRRFYTKRRLTK